MDPRLYSRDKAEKYKELNQLVSEMCSLLKKTQDHAALIRNQEIELARKYVLFEKSPKDAVLKNDIDTLELALDQLKKGTTYDDNVANYEAIKKKVIALEIELKGSSSVNSPEFFLPRTP